MHYLKISYPEAMVELYDLLSKTDVYKSNTYRWKARLLWSQEVIIIVQCILKTGGTGCLYSRLDNSMYWIK